MSHGREIRAVTERGSAVALIRETAKARGCEIGVFDADGKGIDAPADLLRLSPRMNGHGAVLPSGPVGAAVQPILAFDQVLGFVVARPDRAGAAHSAEVAGIGARVLSELCSREFEIDDLSREILAAFEELNLFYDISAELAGATDADSVYRVILERAAAVIRADSAWILALDPMTGILRPAASRGGAVAAAAAVGTVSDDSGAGRVCAIRSCELIEDVSAAGAPVLRGPELLAKRSLVTVPLHVPGRDDRPIVGVLQLADRADGQPFSSGDLKLAAALAVHAAVLVENQRLIGYEKELNIARSIQQGLLPARPPVVAGLDIAGSFVPAAGVGGDYFDYFPLRAGVAGVLVADVSGHSLAAAILQTAARSTFRSEVFASAPPETILTRANRALFDDLTRADLFLTAAYAEVDGATGAVSFASAGHNAALVVRADAAVERGEASAAERLESSGVPIGVLADAGYERLTSELGAGDLLVLFTDGITEAREGGSGEEYGEERLVACLVANCASQASEIVAAVLADVTQFGGGTPAADDRSVVVVKMRDRLSR